MALIERLDIQRRTETRLEISSQIALRLEALINGGNLVRLKMLDPGGIIQRLRHHFARSAVAFEFDQY